MAGLVDLGSALGGPLVRLVGDVLNRVLPPEKMSEKDKAQIESAVLLELSKMDFSQLQGQLAINLAEARSENVFVSGWRPAVGWTCAASLAYTFVIQPMAAFAIGVWRLQLPPLPVLDTGSLMAILGGLLGLGGMRTYEKIKGVGKGL